jgi:hypothetical protein
MSAKTMWYYGGDGFVDAGGKWISLDGFKYDYATVVRVTPCEDAGGPENEYWIDQLCVNIPEEGGEKWNAMVRSCNAEEMLDNTEEPCLDDEDRQLIIVECCVMYGYYDTEWTRLLRIGKEESCRSHEYRNADAAPDIQVRGSSCHDVTIRRLVKRRWLY